MMRTDRKWVYTVRIAKSGEPCGELLLVSANDLPDGVGHCSRAEAKRHHKRRPSARPEYLL